MENSSLCLLKDQLSPGNIMEEFRENIITIMNYENSVMSVTRNGSEILFAYPLEEDPGIYVIAVNGRIAAANNIKAITRYLESLESDGLEILVHKLGTVLDLKLYKKLKEYSLV